MAKDVKHEAAKAVTKLNSQHSLRKAIGETRDAIKDVRRGGHVRSLDGTVH